MKRAVYVNNSWSPELEEMLRKAYPKKRITTVLRQQYQKIFRAAKKEGETVMDAPEDRLGDLVGGETTGEDPPGEKGRAIMELCKGDEVKEGESIIKGSLYVEVVDSEAKIGTVRQELRGTGIGDYKGMKVKSLRYVTRLSTSNALPIFYNSDHYLTRAILIRFRRRSCTTMASWGATIITRVQLRMCPRIE